MGETSWGMYSQYPGTMMGLAFALPWGWLGMLVPLDVLLLAMFGVIALVRQTNSSHCSQDAHQLSSAAKICANCGRAVRDEWRHCANCGQSLTTESRD
jgi:hypothetical protein